MLEMAASVDRVIEMYAAAVPQDSASRYDMTQLGPLRTQVGAEGFRGSAWRHEVYRRLASEHTVRGLAAVGITDGPQRIDAEQGPAQTVRQQSFPVSLLDIGMGVHVESAEASVEKVITIPGGSNSWRQLRCCCVWAATPACATPATAC